MGRTFVDLDPAGYKWVEEPGFQYTATGDVLLRQWTGGEEKRIVAHRLYNPPNSEWLMCRPRQFKSDWARDPLVSEATLRKELWTFAAGIEGIHEWYPLKKPNGTNFQDNKWMHVPSIPSSISSLDACDYSAMGTAAGITIPTGMKTIGFVSHTPSILYPPARELSEADYAPYFQWGSPPSPDELLVFGWSNLALMLYRGAVYLMRTPNNTKLQWELVTKHAPFGEQRSNPRASAPLHMVTGIHGTRHHVMVLPVGPDHIYLYLDQAAPLAVRLRTSENPLTQDRIFPENGSWWIGAASKQSFDFQAQLVAYYEGTDPAASAAHLFDLGSQYKPTVAPTFNLQYRLPVQDDAQIIASAPGQVLDKAVSSTWSNCAIQYQLTQEGGGVWVSDGTNQYADLDVFLTPGNPGAPGIFPGYLTPQLRLFQVRFPIKLTDRERTYLRLDDTQYETWEAETSLRDPDAKRITVKLFDRGLELLENAGLDSRTNYPIHIVEEVEGEGEDPPTEVVRIRGWVIQPDAEDARVEGGAPAGGLRGTGGETELLVPWRRYQLNARGIINRADSEWLYLPNFNLPTGGGHIEHGYVVRESIAGAGINTDDAAAWFEFPDPFTGTDVARLPGAWGATSGVGDDQSQADRFMPGWGQTKLEYALMIATLFRGWLLYERLSGRLNYHPDLALDLLAGGRYGVKATVYRTKAAAAAADVPGQYMMATPTRDIIPPVANCVRITGEGDDAENISHVLDRDSRSWTDSTYSNFTGEPVVKSFAAKAGAKLKDLKRIARVLRLRLSWRQRIWSVVVPLAPWQFRGEGDQEEIEVGEVVTLEGTTRADSLVRFIHVAQVKRDVYLTRLTCERLPPEGVFTPQEQCETDPYPGRCTVAES